MEIQSNPYVKSITFQLTSNFIDFEGKLKISALFNFLLQAANESADDLGFGLQEMHKNGVQWVLSRIEIQINQYPIWNETITVNTWPKSIDGLFYLRDFTVQRGNNILIRATSSWLLINTQNILLYRI